MFSFLEGKAQLPVSARISYNFVEAIVQKHLINICAAFNFLSLMMN